MSGTNPFGDDRDEFDERPDVNALPVEKGKERFDDVMVDGYTSQPPPPQQQQRQPQSPPQQSFMQQTYALNDAPSLPPSFYKVKYGYIRLRDENTANMIQVPLHCDVYVGCDSSPMDSVQDKAFKIVSFIAATVSLLSISWWTFPSMVSYLIGIYLTVVGAVNNRRKTLMYGGIVNIFNLTGATVGWIIAAAFTGQRINDSNVIFSIIFSCLAWLCMAGQTALAWLYFNKINDMRNNRNQRVFVKGMNEDGESKFIEMDSNLIVTKRPGTYFEANRKNMTTNEKVYKVFAIIGGVTLALGFMTFLFGLSFSFFPLFILGGFIITSMFQRFDSLIPNEVVFAGIIAFLGCVILTHYEISIIDSAISSGAYVLFWVLYYFALCAFVPVVVYFGYTKYHLDKYPIHEKFD